jgi:4-hydroxy-3-polyprenylbenzoate decarboxylase
MKDQKVKQSESHNPYFPRLIIGITGASGAILGIRLLEVLKSNHIETHLVLSESAPLIIKQETDWLVEDVLSMANVTYDYRDIGASIASGSFSTLGMVIIPCSIKTLSAVANSYTDDLLSRAADVTLKEGRPLVLVVRETPYHSGHIRLMSEAAHAGAVIFPPVPAYYIHPNSVDDIINNTVGRVLARLGIKTDLFDEWQGLPVE